MRTRKQYSIRLWVAVISLGVSLFIACCDMPNKGLVILFMLPLSFSISILLFGREYAYMKESFGLSVIYISAAVRYIATPFLIAVSHSVVDTISANESDYLYAVIVEIIELFLVMLTIRYTWPKHLQKQERIKQQFQFDFERVGFRLSWIGLLFVVAMVALVVMRGHLYNILAHLSTWGNRVNNKEDLYNYDLMAFNIVKTVIFLLIISVAKKVYDRTSLKGLSLLIAIIAGLFNTMLYVYNERTDLAILIIASFFVLRYAFPKNRKMLGVVFGVGGVLLVAMVFMEGTLNYEIGSSISTVNISDYSKIAELYTTGPSVIANAHMNYQYMRSQVNFMSFAKELVKSFDFFSTLPFLRFILNAVSNGRYSVEIYISSIGGLSYIIPNHSLAALYAGDILCWLLEPLLIILNIKLLGWFERTMFKINDLMQVYAVFSIVTMVAMGVFCNNFTLMLHSFSSLSLWLLVFSYINNLGNTKFKLKTEWNTRSELNFKS